MLTISNFEANYYLPEGMPDQMLAQKRLDRVLAELPAALNGRLRPPASDETAVYRIRHLQLDLWVDALGMADNEVAHNWSRLLLHAVTRALLYGGPEDVIRYEDHAHFLAAFLGNLLNGTAWSRWMYEEFAPLHGLPVGQVTAQLLAPRPELLGPVAERLQRSGQLERLLQTLQPADVELIWQRGLDFRAPDATWQPPADLLADVLQVMGAGAALESASGSWRRNLLRLYLAVIMEQPQLAANMAVAGIVHHLVRLHQLWQARPSPSLWTALAQQEIGALAALDAFLAGLADELATVRDWLQVMLTTPAGRAYLAQLTPIVVPPDVLADAEPTTRLERRRLVTSFAGLAFLLPVMRNLGLHEELDAAGRYQLLLTVIGKARHPLAWGDTAVSWLAGLMPREEEQARTASVTWPDIAQWADSDELIKVADQAADHMGALPGSAVSLLVLRHFATGVRGFAASSPGYLAQQFINLPGRLYIDEESIHVQVSRAPLSVVLRMAGRDGEQGVIPWLGNRLLVIHLP
ncbi:MAG: hypothetical protein KC434_00155 [Anaerolineales bacterium]|nr:hypothetical protein [Anaerolineales bacterium]